jgi:hypothetical protein
VLIINEYKDSYLTEISVSQSRRKSRKCSPRHLHFHRKQIRANESIIKHRTISHSFTEHGRDGTTKIINKTAEVIELDTNISDTVITIFQKEKSTLIIDGTCLSHRSNSRQQGFNFIPEDVKPCAERYFEY